MAGEQQLIEEERLVSGLRAGDQLAFEALIRLHWSRLVSVARRLLQNEADAHDAAQEAFVNAFRSLSNFSGASRLSTWLHRIVVNASLMRLRRRERRHEVAIEDLLPRYLDDGHRVEPAVSWRHEESSEFERKETASLVRRMIDRLPADYRTVLLLRDIEGLDTGEAATTLGVSESCVKVRLHRARQALRELLDPHFRDEFRATRPAAHSDSAPGAPIAGGVPLNPTTTDDSECSPAAS